MQKAPRELRSFPDLRPPSCLAGDERTTFALRPRPPKRQPPPTGWGRKVRYPMKKSAPKTITAAIVISEFREVALDAAPPSEPPSVWVEALTEGSASGLE